MVRSLSVALCAAILMSGCGGGGGGPSSPQKGSQAPPQYTKSERCAAVMDSIYHPELHPFTDWTIARAPLGPAPAELVDEYEELKGHNYEWFWMDRTACYNYAGYIPAWEADRETIKRRLAEMAADINYNDPCEGDERIGEC